MKLITLNHDVAFLERKKKKRNEIDALFSHPMADVSGEIEWSMEWASAWNGQRNSAKVMLAMNTLPSGKE